jgi:hypothetical protein
VRFIMYNIYFDFVMSASKVNTKIRRRGTCISRKMGKRMFLV